MTKKKVNSEDKPSEYFCASMELRRIYEEMGFLDPLEDSDNNRNSKVAQHFQESVKRLDGEYAIYAARGTFAVKVSPFWGNLDGRCGSEWPERPLVRQGV